jgi:hypothetical protein
MTDQPNFMLERAIARVDEATRSLGIATLHGSYNERKRQLANLRSRIECYEHYLLQSKEPTSDGDTR